MDLQQLMGAAKGMMNGGQPSEQDAMAQKLIEVGFPPEQAAAQAAQVIQQGGSMESLMQQIGSQAQTMGGQAMQQAGGLLDQAGAMGDSAMGSMKEAGGGLLDMIKSAEMPSMDEIGSEAEYYGGKAERGVRGGLLDAEEFIDDNFRNDPVYISLPKEMKRAVDRGLISLEAIKADALR